MKRYQEFLFAILAILVLTALVVVVLAFTSFPWWLTKTESARIGGSISAEKQLEAVEAVQGRLLTIAAGIGGLASLLFAGLTWEETRKLNLVNRYSSATEKLGAEAAAGRVAAIYALEQLAREYRRDYFDPVVDVLAAFVRFHTREEVSATQSQGKVRPGSDLQAALTVLGRRNRDLTLEERDPLRFSDCILTGGNLRKADLKVVRFRRARLEDVKFEQAHLEDAEFREAILKNADFEGAHLERANLKKAHLEDAEFKGAFLENADFEGAHLEGADLKEAHLEGANFDGASLEGAHLAGSTGNPKLEKAKGHVHCGQHGKCS
jgi:pentapeptide repeat protein